MQVLGMMESMRVMATEKLTASSVEQLDAVFVDMIPMHHASAINMENDAVKKAKRSQVNKFTQELIKLKNEEITQMERWKKN